MSDSQLSRRTLLALWASAAGSRVYASQQAALPIGITDWNLNLGANPEAVEKAAKLGFRGVQVSFGRKLAGGKMPLDNPEVVARYLTLSKQHGITLDGTCVDRLHDNGLKSDPLALRWVSDSIRISRDLKTKVLLLPFFAPGPFRLRTKWFVWEMHFANWRRKRKKLVCF